MSKSSPPLLIEIQSWMQSIITNPSGVQEALIETNQWINFINTDETTNIDRLDIYAEAYFARIHEAFIIDYPITAFVLGEDQFAKLVAEYLKIYPSTGTNLNNISKSIMSFIKTYSNSEVIHDIVSLERLSLESFYSPIEPVLDPHALIPLKESDWEVIKFSLNSSLKFLTSSWPFEQLWEKRHDMSNIVIKESEELNYFIIERESHHINLSKVSKTEFLILQKISKGDRLSTVGEDFNSTSHEDITILFGQWMTKSYFNNFYF